MPRLILAFAAPVTDTRASPAQPCIPVHFLKTATLKPEEDRDVEHALHKYWELPGILKVGGLFLLHGETPGCKEKFRFPKPGRFRCLPVELQSSQHSYSPGNCGQLEFTQAPSLSRSPPAELSPKLPARLNMDELLKPASIVRTTRKDNTEPDLFQELSLRQHSDALETRPKPQQHKAPATPEDALEILRNEPDYDSLISVLAFLSRHGRDGAGVPSIKLPSPLSAQLVQVLVSEIVPNYWALLIEDVHQPKNSGLRLLLYCLSSIAAVNALLVRLRALVQEAKSESTETLRRPDISLNLGILLDLLCRVLQGDGWLLEAYRVATSGNDGPARVRPRLQEIVSTCGGGRVVSLAAEAEEIAKSGTSGKKVADIWPADSAQYTQWLGRNVVTLVLSELPAEETKFVSDLFAKALRLGNSGRAQITPG